MKPRANCLYFFGLHKVMKASAVVPVQAKKTYNIPTELKSIHIHIPLQNCHGFDTDGLDTY